MIHGFTFSGSGILKRVDAYQTKAGGYIYTLILETHDRWAPLTPIKLVGNLALRVQEFKIGAPLAFTGVVGGRDFKDKVYGDNVASTIEVLESGPTPQPESDNAGQGIDEPGF